MSTKILLQYVELGGYPNFQPLYSSLGYVVHSFDSARKVVAFMRKHQPDVVVGEFNYMSEFRDRVSNLESILAATAQYANVQQIVFYYDYDAEALTRLQLRFPDIHAIQRPIDAEQLQQVLVGES